MFIKRAIAAGIIAADQLFRLHDLNPNATIDTEGREVKMEGGGWKDESMLEIEGLDITDVDTQGGV